ncbi:MAG TPA: hypothetical protein VN944_02305 [Nitrospiria bacterium]|nr:hypothetical protein [Nitrospiria bacterium]
MKKTWYKSKTIWFNIIAILIAVGGYSTGVVVFDAAMTAAIIAIVNIGFRVNARQPLGA